MAMKMNNYRRNNAKTNQPDCFKPWQTQRNRSCSPSRNPKCLTNNHRVAFTDNTKPSRNNSPSKGQDSLHSVFVNHLRRQIPRAAENHPELHMMYKRGKDNQNVNIKQKKEAIHPKLKFSKNVYFEDDIKFYSSSETNMSSNLLSTPCRIQSVRNVIEKFNNLSKHGTNIALKQSFKQKNKDLVPIYEVESRIQSACSKEKVERVSNDKNRKIIKKKLSGAQLRSQVYYKEQEYAKLICDDLLDLFKPSKMKSAQRVSTKTLVLNMERSKELVSAHTQTTPCPSATNIMINVYNQKSPRLIQHGHIKLTPLEIKICQDKNQNTKLSIVQEREELEFEVTKKSVRDCVQKFEEHLKKNGVESEKEMNDAKIFSKIRSNYLLKKQHEPKLSPKAKSVPF